MQKQTNLIIKYHTKDFVEKESEYENYVLVNSQKYREIYAKEDKTKNEYDSSKLQGLVKISYGDCKRSIYRKCKGSSVPSDTIMLGYRSAHFLCDNPEECEVIIKPTNAICYLLHHNDAAIRIPFICALIFGVISIILSITGIILTLVLSCPCAFN